MLKQRNIRKKANEPNFNLELPDEYDDSEDNHWIESLNDSRETVAELPGEDNHWTASNRMEPVEGSQEDSEEEHTSGSVKRMKEFINNISDEEIKTAIDMITNAKETDNHAQGLISNNTDFRSANVETFLFDSGASVSLMGEQIARENNLTINRLDKPRNIYEAFGAKLDIIGSCDIYIKLKVLGKTKKIILSHPQRA